MQQGFFPSLARATLLCGLLVLAGCDQGNSSSSQEQQRHERAVDALTEHFKTVDVNDANINKWKADNASFVSPKMEKLLRQEGFLRSLRRLKPASEMLTEFSTRWLVRDATEADIDRLIRQFEERLTSSYEVNNDLRDNMRQLSVVYEGAIKRLQDAGMLREEARKALREQRFGKILGDWLRFGPKLSQIARKWLRCRRLRKSLG